MMTKDGQVAIVDSRFGKEDKKCNKQVKGYTQPLFRMGYKNTIGYLWYMEEEMIERA